MHTKLTSSLLLILSVFFFVLISCQDDLKTDSRFETDIESTTSTGKVYANAPTELTIKLNRVDGNNKIGNYKFYYSLLAGEGEFFVSSKKIENESAVTLNTNEFKATYFPTSVGEHRIKLTFTNDDFITESIYALSVADYSTQITPYTDNLTGLYTDMPFYIHFGISERGSTDSIYTAQLDIIKGDGIAFLVEENVSSNVAAPDTTIIRFCLPTDTVKQIITRANDNVYRLKTGSNQLYYNPSESGEHILRMTLQNAHGYKRAFDIKMIIAQPDYSVSTTIDSVLYLNTESKFNIALESPVADETYFVSYRFQDNSGRITIGGTEISENQNFTLQPGKHSGTFIPTLTGKGEIIFTVKDKYNTTKQSTAPLNVINSTSTLNIECPTTGKVGHESKLIFSTSKLGYTGNFKGDITITPNANIKVNGKVYTGGFFDVQRGDNNVSIVPTVPGKTKLILTTFDDNNIPTSKEVLLDVSVLNTEINVNYNPVMQLQQNSNINFSIEHSASKVTDYKCVLSGVPGIIKVNGTTYTTGKATPIKKSGNVITLTPSTPGDFFLKIEVYADNSSILIKMLPLSVSKTDVNVLITDYLKEITTGSESIFNFSVSQPLYSGAFTYNISSEPANAGIIKVNGSHYNGDDLIIESNSMVSIGFIPTKVSQIKLIIRIFNTFNEAVDYPIVYDVSNTPIHIYTTNFSGDGKINIPSVFSFQTEKMNYSGQLKYSISSVPANAGTIKVNNTVYAGGIHTLLSSANTLSFTPSIVGDVNLSLEVSDEFGEKAKKEFLYKIKSNSLELTMLGSIDEIVSLEKGGAFNLAVKKENYTGKYYAEVVHEGCKSLKIANIPYSGKTQIDPQNISVRFIPGSLNPVKIFVKITDDESGVIEKMFNFTVSPTELNLTVDNPVNELLAGKESVFNFSATKPGYTGDLKFTVTVAPVNAGTLKIDGIDYTTGEERIYKAGASIPVIFSAERAGECIIKVAAKDNSGGEKSKVFTYNITNPSMYLDVNSFSSASYLQEKNSCFVSAAKEHYSGTYQYEITQSPAGVGTFLIDDIIYSGGKKVMPNPERMKITFVPTQVGSVSTLITVTDDFGGQTTKTLEYVVTNPTLSVTLSKNDGELTVGKETSFSFTVAKPEYTGDFFSVLTGENCTGLKVNGTVYTPGQKVEIPAGDNKVMFVPTAIGKDAVKIQLKITDERGGEENRIATFSAKTAEVSLSVYQENKDVKVGVAQNFNFIGTKENNDTLRYELKLSPANIGMLRIGNNDYAGGSTNFVSGTPVNVQFTATRPGAANIVIRIADKYGKQAEKTAVYNVINPPLSVMLSKNDGELTVGKEGVLTFTVTKPEYTGDFFSVLTGENCTGLKVNGTDYTSGQKVEILTGDNKVMFVPTAIGKDAVKIQLKVTDEWGGEINDVATFSTKSAITVIGGIDEWKDGKKQLIAGEKKVFPLQIESSKPPTCKFLSSFQNVNLSTELEVYVNGNKLADNATFTFDNSTVIEFVPLRFKPYDIRLVVDGVEKHIYFNAIVKYDIVDIPVRIIYEKAVQDNKMHSFKFTEFKSGFARVFYDDLHMYFTSDKSWGINTTHYQITPPNPVIIAENEMRQERTLNFPKPHFKNVILDENVMCEYMFRNLTLSIDNDISKKHTTVTFIAHFTDGHQKILKVHDNQNLTYGDYLSILEINTLQSLEIITRLEKSPETTVIGGIDEWLKKPLVVGEKVRFPLQIESSKPPTCKLLTLYENVPLSKELEVYVNGNKLADNATFTFDNSTVIEFVPLKLYEYDIRLVVDGVEKKITFNTIAKFDIVQIPVRIIYEKEVQDNKIHTFKFSEFKSGFYKIYYQDFTHYLDPNNKDWGIDTTFYRITEPNPVVVGRDEMRQVRHGLFPCPRFKNIRNFDGYAQCVWMFRILTHYIDDKTSVPSFTTGIAHFEDGHQRQLFRMEMSAGAYFHDMSIEEINTFKSLDIITTLKKAPEDAIE